MNMNMIEKLTTNIAKLFHEKGIRYEYEPDVIDDMLQLWSQIRLLREL